MSSDLKILEDLTEEEKQAVNEIIKEISKNGKSDDLTNLYYEDYEEIPVDLETFLCSPIYLGNYTNNGKDIYETWKKELAYVHNPATFCDQWAITGSTGTGKAQPLDSLVFTPKGYIKIRDIKIGDIIVDGMGKETRVTHIYPQGKKPVYKVTFSDRTSTLCAEDHLWKVGERRQLNKQSQIVYSVKTTKELLDSGLRQSDRWKYRLPLPIVNCWNEEAVDIDPYLMGLLLGDGNLTNLDCIKISFFEDDLYQKAEQLLNKNGYKLQQISDKIGQYRINLLNHINSNQFSKPKGFHNLIKKYDLLGKKSIEKHIPKEYLYTSVDNRIKLLQGLFDTDGCIDNRNKRSQFYFNTSSPQLSEDFAFLIRSLGGTDTVIRKKARYKDDENNYIECNDTYEHLIKLPNEILPFSSKKHSEKYIKPQHGPIKRIVNIEYIEEQECQCIVVESDDHTYLTNDLIVTHNSTVATYSLAYELYKLMCLKNPNRFYLNADETIWILFFNLNLKLAEKTMWGKFQKALQKSPWFMERGTVKGRTNLIYQPNKDIRLDIGSTEEHALSVAVMYVAIDEMSFGDNDNVDYLQAGMMQIYNQLYLRLSSRFSRGGKIMGRMYLISSAKSTNAVLESFIRDNEGQPGMHVSRYKQWEVLPENRFSDRSTWFKLAVGNELLSSFIMGHPTEEEVKEAEMKGYNVIDVPSELLHRFEMDMNRTLIDTCGIAVQSSYKYIPYRIIEPCIGKQENPFIEEIIKTGLGDSKQIKDFFDSSKIPEILYKKKIYVHCDLSKSGDRTGISAVAVLGYKNQEHFDDQGEQSTMKEIVFRHIFTVGIQCPPNDELSMIKVKDFIHYLKYDLGWNIVGVSCDGYQSLMLLQHLKIDHFNANEVSMDIIKNKECVGYTIFRNTLVEQRIRLIKLPELFKEITSLEKNDDTGKVDHPRQTVKIVNGETIKSVGKDESDSLGGAIYNATMSVNMNELDLLSAEILTSDTTLLNSKMSIGEKYFGFTSGGLYNLQQPLEKSIDEELDNIINQESLQEKKLIDNYKETNKNTKLSDTEIKSMINGMYNSDLIIM